VEVEKKEVETKTEEIMPETKPVEGEEVPMKNIYYGMSYKA